MCSSTRSAASQTSSRSTPGSWPIPVSACVSDSAETRCSRERDRVDRAGDQVGAGAGRLEREREPVPAGALAVEADRQTGHLPQLGHELACPVGLEQAGGIVEQDARGADLGQPLRGLDQRLVAAAAVEEPGVELAPGRDHGLGGGPQVRGVVERVMEPEDVDPALGGARHEAADEVVADRPRADEEAAADRKGKRCLRARLERADPLPGALDPALDCAVEAAAARDLEVGVARARRGSPRAGAARRSGSLPRAAPARGRGWTCRRASASRCGP